MIHSNSIFDNINFNGGQLSSDGGSILLSQFLKQIHLDSILKDISFWDFRTLPVYSNTTILKQLIQRCLLGYHNQSDQRLLLNDPLLSSDSLICSQPTVSRFFDRVTPATNQTFREILTRMACRFINEKVSSPILDADSTLITTCGKQEASAYIHHYQENGYHPFVINEYQSKLLVSSVLRTGSSYSSNGVLEELQTVFSCLEHLENLRFRADSAFDRNDLFQFLEDNRITYYIRTKGFKALKREALENMVLNEIDWNQFDHAHPYYGDFSIKAKGNRTRRIIYKVFYLEENGMQSLIPSIYCIITNNRKSSPKEAMKFYEARGNSENFTKELKDDFDGGTLSIRVSIRMRWNF